MTALIAILAFIAALGPLIVFHELGHYWVARLFNVRVLRFSVGFGRPLLKLTVGKDQTEWALAAIPFGGFVAMLDERELDPGQYTEAELTRAFNRQSVWARSAIVVAGPLANFCAAIFLYSVVYLHGVAEPRAILAEPPAATIAARAGLHGGDEVIAVDGHPIASLVSLRFRLIQDAVDAQDARVTVKNSLGGLHDVMLDFSAMKASSVEGDLLGSVGITVAPPAPVIESVQPDSPAEAAGLLAGDRVLAVNDTAVTQVDSFVDLIRAAPNQALLLTLERSGLEVHSKITPNAHDAPDGKKVGTIGVNLRGVPMAQVQYGLVDSVIHSATQTWDMTTFSARMLGKMARGQVSLKNLSGPVTIADYAGQSARLGLGIFLSFIAFISISLGLMNLLPIPMLDGGHLLYYCVEIIKGKPPSERFLEMSQRAGMALLACLMSVALFNDFSRLLS